MTTKANLAYGEFKLELEGSEAFVVSQLEVFGGKIPQLKVGNFPQNSDDRAAKPVESDDSEAAPAKEEKKQRRVVVKSNGPSCGARIRGLIEEGFFDTVRKSAEISERLKEKATPYEGKHISAAVINLTKAGSLRRMKQEGVWVYVKP